MSTLHDLTTIRYDASQGRYFKRTVPRALGPNEVLIKTTHSGLCYTDVHAKKSKTCGLGHEGVGHVVKTGASVASVSVGARVGWGWLHHVRDIYKKKKNLPHLFLQKALLVFFKV